MIEDFQVPDEFFGAFRRLVRRMPLELQRDEAFLQSLVMYLKLGGEKLARHRIEVEKAEFVTAFTIVKRQPPVAPNEAESADNDDTRDDQDQEDEMDDDEGEVADIDPDTIAT